MRRTLTTKQRVQIFKDADGVCDICSGKILVGDRWEVSHRIPLALGGEDASGNMFPVHAKCHRAHTSETDVPAIARAKRREARHLGVRKPRSIRSWRKFSGEIVHADRERD